MKKTFTLFIGLILFAGGIFAQTGFSYQAVLRDSKGVIRDNEAINLVAELIQNDVTVYSETHSVVTNDFGAFTIIVGQGASGQNYSPSIFLNTDSTGVIETILKISEDGGNVLSESAILGVPVAEVAKVALTAHMEFPAGVILPFAGPVEKIPAGWLPCDGQAYNQVDYPELFAVIGTYWGGPAPETFNVPDLRGVVLRGVNGSSADAFSDPDNTVRISRHTGGAIGNSVGSYQADEFKSHKHQWKYYQEQDDQGTGGSYNEFTFSQAGTIPDANQPVLATGGSETRSKNAYVNFIIKY
jgi:microcystin-dependent protein